MADIVERLRDNILGLSAGDDLDQLLHEAAVEIERLRADPGKPALHRPRSDCPQLASENWCCYPRCDCTFKPLGEAK